jgi:hypothetical protein
VTAGSDVGPKKNKSTDGTEEINIDIDVESEACRKRKQDKNSGGCTCKKRKVS